MKYLRMHLTGYNSRIIFWRKFCRFGFFTNSIFALMFLYLKTSPKLKKKKKKIVKNNNFLSSIEPQPQKVGYFTQFEIFRHVGGSKRSHTNLKSKTVDLKWVNLKYKAEHELHWCHFRFQHNAEWSVEGISYIILLDRWYKETVVVHQMTTSE